MGGDKRFWLLVIIALKLKIPTPFLKTSKKSHHAMALSWFY